MKKILARIVSIFFMATVSLAVVGCSKKEEPKPAETAAPAAEQAPAPAAEAPAPAAPAATETPAAPAAK